MHSLAPSPGYYIYIYVLIEVADVSAFSAPFPGYYIYIYIYIYMCIN